jgi:uncharacterized CHY-type Zn-finger protein
MTARRKQTWILKCGQCRYVFDVNVYSSQSVILTARKTVCPKCGHVPRLGQRDAIWSVTGIHRVIGLKEQWKQRRPIQRRSKKPLRDRHRSTLAPVSNVVRGVAQIELSRLGRVNNATILCGNCGTTNRTQIHSQVDHSIFETCVQCNQPLRFTVRFRDDNKAPQSI